MDTITHGFVGLLTARALASGSGVQVMAAGLTGAVLPDLDFVGNFWDPMAAVTVHRTITHSFLGGVMLAVVTAAVIRRFGAEKFSRLFTVGYLGILSHIALDLLTPFGPAILWPLANRRFSLEQNYVIDPILSAFAVGFLAATLWRKERRISLARMGLAAMAFYVLIAGIQQRFASSRWHAFLQTQGIEPLRSTVVPLFPGPFRWKGVSETKEAFYQQSFWLFGSPPQAPRVLPKMDEYLEPVENLKEVKLFLNLARFPWRHVQAEGSFRVIAYEELAFADHPLGGPLSVRVWIDESNAVKKIELGHFL
jgi:inner membrane protein